MKSVLHLAANDRLGIVPAPRLIPTTLADVRGVFHSSVPAPNGASGGVGWTPDEATTAAVGEALERYAAATHPLVPWIPSDAVERYETAMFTLFSQAQLDSLPTDTARCQRSNRTALVEAVRLHDRAQVAVPRALVSLSDLDGLGVATSNGLAAGPSLHNAALRGLQELIERDALMSAWLHGLRPSQLQLPRRLSDRLPGGGAEVSVVNITPSYSPWPVFAVCGSLLWRGKPRIGMGAACRASTDAAVDKAFLEWSQATVFVGVHLGLGTTRTYKAADEVIDFDDHALYFSARPDEWAKVPFVQGSRQGTTGGVDVPVPRPLSDEEQLAQGVEALRTAGLDVLVADLTTDDLATVGVHAVRVLVPGLIPVNSDHRWPFLGGTTSNRSFRFPTLQPAVPYPNPFPHPLG